MENKFLVKLFEKLRDNKCYPKYQMERRVDIFFNFFLPDIIKHEFGPEYEPDIIIPELPIKNIGNNQSSNLDYFVVCNKKKTAFLVELKTDKYSCNPAQLLRYDKMQIDGFSQIIKDAREIAYSTTSKYISKYDYLNIMLSTVEPDIQLKLVYLLPDAGKKKLQKVADEKGISVHFITLENLKKIEFTGSYADEWNIFMNSNLF